MKKLETKNQKIFQKLELFSKYDSILKTSSRHQLSFPNNAVLYFPKKLEFQLFKQNLQLAHILSKNGLIS